MNNIKIERPRDPHGFASLGAVLEEVDEAGVLFLDDDGDLFVTVENSAFNIDLLYVGEYAIGGVRPEYPVRRALSGTSVTIVQV